MKKDNEDDGMRMKKKVMKMFRKDTKEAQV